MAKDQAVILVSGGAGYIGSHSVLLLINRGYRVVVIDNCLNTYLSNYTDSNGNVVEIPESLRRVEELTGKRLSAFYKLDLVTDSLDGIFQAHSVRAVIHFAALKCVSESISLPLEYYSNNLIGSINLLNTMKRFGCKHLIFSSSATVYGLPKYMPVDERHPTGENLLNPYGRTKYMIEQILMDLCPKSNQPQDSRKNQKNQNWSIISLRYFNPVGAHPSGTIGEHVQGVPNNLMPYISQVSVGKREKLFIFGNDFDTPDGTGVRDYIHIMDLAKGHVHALDFLLKSTNQDPLGFKVYNLGTGKGYSVLEVIKTFESINNVKIPYEITERRAGDAGEVFAEVALARKELGWSAQYSLVDMVRDTYRWQVMYPDGFKCPAEHHSDTMKCKPAVNDTIKLDNITRSVL